MKPVLTLVTALFSLLAAACGQAKFSAVNIPASFKGGEVIKDISYGDLPAQKLDIYLPQNTAGTMPVVIFFHGGRWTDGTKDQYAFVGKKFSELGYMAVIPGTRQYPKVKFPAFMHDTAAAVAFVADNISEYGGDPENIFLSGHSSGAHKAALVIADEKYLQAHGHSPNIIRAFAGLAGPYDFVPQAPDIKNIFGPPENYPAMQVTNFIDGDEPPMLLIHGTDDQTVKISNLHKLAEGIENRGGNVQTKILPGINHIDLIRDFSWLDAKTIHIPDIMIDFFSKNAQ